MVTRRQAVLRALALAALGIGAACSSDEQDQADAGAGWNVVLITVDSLRWDHLGTYGYPRATSPNLDRFASQSVVFGQAIVQWPDTSQSFASMLTSTYSFANGVRDRVTPLDGRFETLAERLKRAGYRTLGAVASRRLNRQLGFGQGFDEYHEVRALEGEAELPDGSQPSPARRTTSQALAGVDRWQKSGGDEPLFLWAHYVDPHGPYRPPEPQQDVFLDDEWFDGSVVLDPRGEEDPDNPRWSMGCLNEIVMDGDERRRDFYVARYDAEIRAVDHQFQVLLKGLRERGLQENTLVIFTADHGESLGDHEYYFDHGVLPYDASSRVPLFIRYPEVTPARVPRVVGLIDLVPTVLDLLGLPQEGLLQGRSLRPLLEGASNPPSPFVYSEGGIHERSQQVVRTQRWKLIWVRDPQDRALMTGDEFELYDVAADPLERTNVAAEHPGVVETLSLRLEGRLRAIQAARRMKAAPDQNLELDPVTRGFLAELGYL